MWSIHPNQIRPIVEAFLPEADEIEEAVAILAAAQAADWAPIRHAGILHDRASYRYYWRLLVRARSAGAPLPEAATRRFFADPATARPDPGRRRRDAVPAAAVTAVRRGGRTPALQPQSAHDR